MELIKFCTFLELSPLQYFNPPPLSMCYIWVWGNHLFYSTTWSKANISIGQCRAGYAFGNILARELFIVCGMKIRNKNYLHFVFFNLVIQQLCIFECWKWVIGFRRLNCPFDAFVILHNFKDLKANLYHIDLS